MLFAASSTALLALSFIQCFTASAQSTNSSGYTDYNLSVSGDPDSVIYETASTDTSDGTADQFGPPDVHLNASVHVGEIDLLVKSLSAKLNLDAQVLSLLNFSAGVNLQIGEVDLTIQNVTAEVQLEVRLANLVSMINTTLSSLDLNPVLATLGEAVGDITNDVSSALGSTTGSTGTTTNSSTSNISSRSAQFALQQEILYSLNDYSGNTHTNRVLEQNGDIVDQSLDNNGHVYNSQVVGSYATLMTKVGEPKASVVVSGQSAEQQEYVYVVNPVGSFGLEVICYVYTGADGSVIATRVVAEIEGGGYSTVSDGVVEGS